MSNFRGNYPGLGWFLHTYVKYQSAPWAHEPSTSVVGSRLRWKQTSHSAFRGGCPQVLELDLLFEEQVGTNHNAQSWAQSQVWQEKLTLSSHTLPRGMGSPPLLCLLRNPSSSLFLIPKAEMFWTHTFSANPITILIMHFRRVTR